MIHILWRTYRCLLFWWFLPILPFGLVACAWRLLQTTFIEIVVYHFHLNNNATSVCIFIGCWAWSIKGHTQMASIHVRSRQQTCFSFFMPQRSFNKPYEFFLYKRNRYCNKSQKTSQCVKNNSHATRLRLVSYLLFFTRCDVICDLLQYTHTENVIYLLNKTNFNISRTKWEDTEEL